MSENSTSIQSVEATLDVVEFFLTAGSGLCSVTEIARGTGFTMNRVWRILTTLVKRGYIQQDPITSQYCLGSGFVALADVFSERSTLKRLCEPLLTEITEITGDVAALDVRSGHVSLCVDIRIGKHFVQAMPSMWEPMPLHYGASPKVLLAFTSEPQYSEIINRLKFDETVSPAALQRNKLMEDLELIRSRGYCVWQGNQYKAVAAPVWDHQGRVVAALSLFSPDARSDENWRQTAIELILGASQKLSASLGYSENRR